MVSVFHKTSKTGLENTKAAFLSETGKHLKGGNSHTLVKSTATFSDGVHMGKPVNTRNKRFAVTQRSFFV